ncbi:MAG TPA: serine/threonine-protein kinase [Polyangiaceae bacterium]
MERIGEYLVVRMLGEGGMGKVYEAEERLSKRKVALKVLRPELTKNEDGRRLFLNEMQILAHLEHPNVVRSLASFEADGQLVMVLEYLKGKTLREEMNARGSLPWHEAVELLAKIAGGLEVAHGQEPAIIHRDLKPENVMLTTDDDGSTTGLKVMDFGIAKVLAAAHATNTQSIGTLQYMSPEQIDARTIDARSDLYSLGLMFYEMISGKPPFSSASPRELLNLQCTGTPPELSDDVRRGLPRGVENLLFSLIEKNPDARPASAADVVSALSPFLSAGAGEKRTTTSISNHVRSSKKTPVPPTVDDAESSESEEEEEASATSKKPARTGDTLHSSPKPKKRAPLPKNDTVALVERATSEREISTPKALVLIAAVSLFAGVATYMIRAHERRAAVVDSTTTTTATIDRGGASDEAQGDWSNGDRARPR